MRFLVPDWSLCSYPPSPYRPVLAARTLQLLFEGGGGVGGHISSQPDLVDSQGSGGGAHSSHNSALSVMILQHLSDLLAGAQSLGACPPPGKRMQVYGPRPLASASPPRLGKEYRH